MASIFIYAEYEKNVRETLLYAYKNQMKQGTSYLKLTIKHKDGYRDSIEGSIDRIFKSQILKEVESNDAVLLQHSHYKEDFNRGITEKVESLGELLDISENLNICNVFILPKSGPYAYFIFKNSPMFEFDINKNIVISTCQYNRKASLVTNNVVGRVDLERGYFSRVPLDTKR